MFRPDDIIEATEDHQGERGRIAKGDRHTVAQVSASGNFVRLHGCEVFLRAVGWKLVERPGRAA